ncbi:unnamed protein product [Phaeothamnion confervicola]
MTYNKLVGEADCGNELPAEDFAELLQRYTDSWENRLAVRWRNAAGRDCVRIKPSCWCMCGHTFKAHAWWDADSKKLSCRCAGCRCGGFAYLPRQGSWILTCSCKHPATDHQTAGVPGPCIRAGCACTALDSKHVDMCGESWHSHATVVETTEERRAGGLAVDADVVAKRLEDKAREKPKGCGKCVGCKCRMACRKGFRYSLTGGAL